MSLSTNQSLIRGTFTSNGSSAAILVPWVPSFFKVRNITQFGSTDATTPVMLAERTTEMPQASALTTLKTNGAATLQLPDMNLTDGITFVDGSTLTVGTELTGTSITAANPAVVTIANHGFGLNEQIRLYNTTGMLQIAGLEFTVTNVLTINTFEIGLDASGFAAPATALNARITPLTRYFPEIFIIQNITQAPQAVVTINRRLLSPDTSTFTVGQVMTFRVTSDFGMVEMNNLQGEIIAVDGGNAQYTVDINTSSFTTFAYPDSATAGAGVTFPQIVPIGKDGAPTTFDADNFFNSEDVLFNQSRFVVELGTNAIGGNNDLMEWHASNALSI